MRTWLTAHLGPFLRRLPAALLGSIVAILLELAINPATQTEVARGHVAGLIPEFGVGFIGGWLFDLCRDMAAAAENLAKLNSSFVQYLGAFFKRDPYALISKESPHSGVIGRLLRRSIESGYTAITGLNTNEYLNFLRQAISASESFDGVQRHPVRWFFLDTIAPQAVGAYVPPAANDSQVKSSYLSSLRAKDMRRKRRVFVIPDSEVTMMEQDLKDDHLMARYWEETGSVETFWVPEGEFRRFYDVRSASLDDLALFDEQLLIKYDATRGVLTFDLIGPDDPSQLIFHNLDVQLRADSLEPFRRIRPKPSPVRECTTEKTYARRDDAYAEFPNFIHGDGPVHVDLLQFTGETARGVMRRIAAEHPKSLIRLLLASAAVVKRYDENRKSFHLVRLQSTIDELRLLKESAACNIEVREYDAAPSPSIVLCDNNIGNLSWYRVLPMQHSDVFALRGHDSAAITVGVTAAPELLNFGRNQFDVVWKTAREVDLDAVVYAESELADVLPSRPTDSAEPPSRPGLEDNSH